MKYYLGLHSPTIKGLIGDKYDQWMNYKKLIKTVIEDFIYIVNITEPGTNRH